MHEGTTAVVSWDLGATSADGDTPIRFQAQGKHVKPDEDVAPGLGLLVKILPEPTRWDNHDLASQGGQIVGGSWRRRT